MTAFATVEELSVRLLISTPAPETSVYDQLAALLEDASNDLRDQIGQPIDPGTLTWTTRVPAGQHIELPGVPIRSVASVVNAESGAAVTFTLEDSRTIRVDAPMASRVTVTYDYGWTTIPNELKKWTMVLAAATRAAAMAGNLGLAGGIASVGVDDGRVTFATNAGEEGLGVMIPERVLGGLRSRYGMSSIVLEQRP